MQALVEERDNSVDPYYVEDFLLMYRTFIKNPVEIFEKFMLWFAEASLREKVCERRFRLDVFADWYIFLGGPAGLALGEQSFQRFRNGCADDEVIGAI